MTTTATPTQQPYVVPVLPDDVGGAHTTVVSIGVMLLVTIILVELAGTSHEVALGVGVLLLALVFMVGMKLSSSQLNKIMQYPAVP